MAVAAFRSTTKRSCRISSSESDGTSSPDAPSTKRGLMRMKSLPTVSSRYLSDSSSSPEYIRSRSLSRHLPSDSESEVDGSYSSCTKGRQGIPEFRRRSEVQSSSHRSDFHRSSTKYRRLMSHQELPQVSRAQGVSRFGKKDADKKVSGGQLEIHEVEERTIRAVHAQMKSLERDPPSGDILDLNHLYAVIREEVQRAVAGIKKELEESVEKDRMAAFIESLSFKKSHMESVNAEAIKLSSGISNPSAAKFLQSQERAQELRWQLEEEERRVVDLANSVNGLHLHGGSLRPGTQCDADKKLYSSLLDEDAHTYFKEYVSIVNLETPEEAQKECTDGKTFSYVKAKRQDGDDVPLPEVQATIRDFGIVGRECKKVKRRPVNVDGIVMPWLDCDWNSDSLFPLLEGKQEDAKLSKEAFCSNDASNTPHIQNRAEVQCSPTIAKVLTNQQEQAHKDSQKVQGLKPQACLKTKGQCPAYVNNAISDSLRELDSYQINGPAIRLLETKAAKMAQTSSPTNATSTGSFMQFTGKIASPQDSENYFGADNILSQRRRFKSKITRGGMLLCGGKL